MKLACMIFMLSSASSAFAVDYNLGCNKNSPVDALCSLSVTEGATSNEPLFREDTHAVSWDEIINIGKEIWKIINENKPVVSTQYDFATALPKGIASAGDLDNWQMPTSKNYQVLYKNTLGMNVVDYQFTIASVYGGNFEGRGKYLADVRVIPGNLNVMWGYNFAATVKVVAVYNVGSKESPLAALSLVHNWVASTPVLRNEQSQYFVVRGDGFIDTLSHN